MPFMNRDFIGTRYISIYANLICEDCGESFSAHFNLTCPYEHYMEEKPEFKPVIKPKTVCEKAVAMYKRQPYYKKLKGTDNALCSL